MYNQQETKKVTHFKFFIFIKNIFIKNKKERKKNKNMKITKLPPFSLKLKYKRTKEQLIVLKRIIRIK
jgi:hypothetical protein